MQMTVFGSGSAGNCYLLHSPTEALIIEAGVRPESRMYACFGSDFSRLAGLLVSHRHADHAAYARQWSEGGVPVLATADVMERCAIHDPFSTTITPGRWATVGRFRVLPFPLIHYDPDGTRCPNVGFIIDHPETGRILFATDCESLSREELTPQGMRYTPYQFTGVVHWMLEANYESHLSVANAVSILRSSDLSQTRDIMLLHMSERNSVNNESKITRRVRIATGKRCFLARAGLSVNYSF